MKPWRAVLLAGGRSSRMGADKALLPWGGGTLLSHMHALLQAAGAQEVIVSGDRPGLQGIPDTRPDTGPMGALAQLAPRLQDGAWIVVPVDMPLLSSDLLQALLATDAACVCVEDHPLPMALRLDADMRAVIEGMGNRTGRERSLRALQQHLHAVHVPASPWQQTLRNCNTPEEWMALQGVAR
ncbi:molybdenum cofactor guanylyltransferase [Pseudoxanthomonas sp. SL93]|uniref:molybdenum cofactor guanylyltransferase n=1 Tax=Pseudoxanthomonas sp. SL93 TaxID=2995142 RepID=UPI00226DC35A|nr:molybdenum cofactor guanylyltransferase [Pseudoxanthomonas sp. SL93]WAC62091.1 molybdenum cofactor guanylyltransferase [Pseudoxanthomonas sp. SL93]